MSDSIDGNWRIIFDSEELEIFLSGKDGVPLGGGNEFVALLSGKLGNGKEGRALIDGQVFRLNVLDINRDRGVKLDNDYFRCVIFDGLPNVIIITVNVDRE